MRNLLYLFLVGFSFAFSMDQEGTGAQECAGGGAASAASTPPKYTHAQKVCISISPTPSENPDGTVNVHFKPADQAADKTSPTKSKRLSITDVEAALKSPLSPLPLGAGGERFPTIPNQAIYGYQAGEEVPSARKVLAAQIEHQRRRSAELEEIEEACAAIQRFFKELEKEAE